MLSAVRPGNFWIANNSHKKVGKGDTYLQGTEDVLFTQDSY